jgi:hypothetical protein
MQTFKVPRSESDLPRQLQKMRLEAEEKLRVFCTKKILDHKLSTKTFNYQFDISGARAGGQRKSVQKLKDILYKAVKKQVPYIEYIAGGDIIINSTSSNAVALKIVSPYMTFDVEPWDSISTLSERMHWVRSMRRYTKYLNFKCMRGGIPLNLERIRFTHETHPEDMNAFHAWNQTQASPCKVRMRITLTAKLSIRGYFYDEYVRVITNNLVDGINTYEDYENYLIEYKHNERLASLRDVRNWETFDITSRRVPTFYPGVEKYVSAEKIFLILEELQQVIKTLSRKVSYDTAAFNIGSSEAS